MMLIVSPPCRTAVFLARIVMPFSRSRSPESMTRSSTSWFSRNAPDCQSMASTSVVLPWSTWATIATFRRSSRVEKGMRARLRLVNREWPQTVGGLPQSTRGRPPPGSAAGGGTLGAAMSMVIRPRSAALAPFVRSLAYDDGPELPPRRERILPGGGVSLMVNLHEDEFRTYHGPGHATVRRVAGAMLAGPRAEHTVIDTAEQRRIVTVSFTPAGAAQFFAVPLAETRDQLVELRDLWGGDGAVLRERLLTAASPVVALRFVEAVLLDHLAGPPAPDPAVVFAVR